MKTRKLSLLLSGILFFLIILPGCKQKTDIYNRGVGIYPGNPKEDFSPTLVVDNTTYRNIAKLRPAYHSSSYDYNLTAQLVTDGIITDKMPDYITLVTNKGLVPKNEREWLLDNNSLTELSLSGNDIWIQIGINPDNLLPPISKISLR